ncbi:MAG: ABC transporter permease subunit [Pseudomonadota bacterium]
MSAARALARTNPAPSIKRRRDGSSPWITIGLYGSACLTLFLPLLVAFLWSVVDPQTGWFAPDIVPRSLSLHHWEDALGDPSIIRSIVLSLLISTVVTFLTGILALPTAFALAKIPFRWKRTVEIFILAPLIVPGIIIGIGVGTLFLRMGLAYTVIGVILVQTIGTLPFMIRILAATLEAIPNDLLHAARTLGATPLKLARHILVPLAWPGFIAGGLLSFIRSFEEFDKTFIVGAPIVQTITVKLWAFLGGKIIIFPNAAVLTFILVMPMLVIFFLAERFLREDVLAAGMGKL